MPTNWRHESRQSLQAWIRTGVSLMVVGAIITAASLALGAETSADRLVPWTGTTLVGLGIVSIVGAVVGYRRALARGSRASGASEAAARIMAGLIAIAGSLLIIILIADAC
jgi:uncharacterized membrane protein YidH (DUF202 family)